MNNDPNIIFKDTCHMCALIDGIARGATVLARGGESEYQTGCRRGAMGGFAMGLAMGRSPRDPAEFLCFAHKEECTKALRILHEVTERGDVKEASEELATRTAIDKAGS